MKRTMTWGGALVTLIGAHTAVAQDISASGSATATTTAAPAADATASATPAADPAAPAATDPPAEPVSAEPAPAAAAETPSTPAYAGARATRGSGPSAAFGSVPYMQRYKPTRNLWEVGLFTGLFFPSRAHNLQSPDSNNTAERFLVTSPELGARLAYFPLSFLGIEAEGMLSPSRTQDTGDTALLYAARGQAIAQLPYWSIVPFLTVGGGMLGASSVTMGHDADPAFHFGVGAKAPINHIVSIRLDLRDTLTQKRNTDQGTPANSFDILLGATFTFERPVPVADTDYDGLYDNEDKCPTNGALTADGCPQDSDADGLFDTEDRCPNEFASTTDGCPEVVVAPSDVDGDGIPVPCDMCPDTKGVAPDGCALKDTDGDGLDDAQDKCPKEPETRNGFEDADGCPDQMPEAMKRFTGVMTGIAFDQGKATIRKESHKTLDAAYEVLAKYPSISIEISGHTSSEGKPEVNQKLSEDRAAAVRDYLVKKGIAPERVIARGAGASEPIADNATPAGRQENRRIEFKIVADP